MSESNLFRITYSPPSRRIIAATIASRSNKSAQKRKALAAISINSLHKGKSTKKGATLAIREAHESGQSSNSNTTLSDDQLPLKKSKTQSELRESAKKRLEELQKEDDSVLLDKRAFLKGREKELVEQK